MSEGALRDPGHVSLVEVLDRVINKGAVITGEVTIAVADIDLIHLALQLVLASAASLEKETPLVVQTGERGEREESNSDGGREK